MLVLVAGATGNLGQYLVDSLHSRGHQVRALGRTPSKLEPSRQEKLESFVQSEAYHDVAALDRACQGVDAVICAYSGIPELQLEGQLLLLRAAERAGVKKYVAHSWNMDWRDMKLGDHESYDPFISFRHHVEGSSDIKPNYIFSGILAEVLFSAPGHVSFSPTNNGCWDHERKIMEVWGTGDEIWHWTSEHDAAKFTAAIIERDEAAEGGFWSVCSGANTLKEIAMTYGKVRDCEVDIQKKGDVNALRERALEGRRQGSRKNFWTYIGWFYQLYTVDGTWTLRELDNEKLGVKGTSLGEFLRQNPGL
ncbi:NAD(P)-binding [Fusarium albosuccineum]|uniref:NAD(P)-binding n=1 Tax=Fusarium albosuccineum TaxID=1237068 RepID=A0A8H4PFU2_9HYPO|nr:NAD(P)-binding [Fusarium albosuccineum]